MGTRGARWDIVESREAAEKAAERQAKLAETLSEDDKKLSQNEGLTVWRIENLEMVPVPEDMVGKFFDGDAYIVLKTSRKGSSNKLSYDLFFWLGANCSTDEMGAAAYLSVQMDEGVLGGAATQHREVMQNESKMFKKCFQAIEYMPGGVSSGMKHVEPDTYPTRLLKVKGTKDAVRVIPVAVSASELSAGDVFILDLAPGNKIILWNGSASSVIERSKGGAVLEDLERKRVNRFDGVWRALPFCCRLLRAFAAMPRPHLRPAYAPPLTRACAHVRAGVDGREKVSVAALEQNEMKDDDPDAKLFWAALGGKPEGGIPATSAEEASADDAASAAQSAHSKIWHVRFESGGAPTVKELSQRPLSKKMLLSDDAFVLELSSAVWVWIGEKANKEERRAAMKQAGDLMDSSPKTLLR